MKRRLWAAVLLLALVAAGIVVVFVISARQARAYPTTPEGWAARWEAAAAEFGRTPGEGWDVWLEVREEIEAASADANSLDRIATALDRLVPLTPTRSIPDTIGTENMIDDFFPIVTSARNVLSGYIVPQLQLALQSGDPDQAVIWWNRGLALCRVTESAGMVIGQLVQDACYMALIWSIHERLIDPDPVDTDVIAGMLADLRVTDDLSWFIVTEREFGLGSLNDRYSTTVERGILIAADEPKLYEEMMNLWIRSHRGMDSQADKELRALENLINSSSIYSLRRPNISTMIPSFSGTVGVRRSVLIRVDGVHLLLALRRHHERTGVFPKSLGDLVPTDLSALPRDPFAFDGQYRYRQLDASSSDPVTAFVLYSIGADRVDDGGRWPEDWRANPLTSASASGDHLFNQPRPQPPAEPEDDPAWDREDDPSEQP